MAKKDGARRSGAPRADEAPPEIVEVAVSPVELLSTLARLDLEAARAYDAAAELSPDGELHRRLRAFAGDHRRHARELNALLERDGDPQVDLSAEPPLLAGIMSLAGPLGPEVVAVALLGNEQLTNLSCDAALAYAWEGDVERMLEGFAADERRHLAFLAEWHDRAAGHPRPEQPGGGP